MHARGVGGRRGRAHWFFFFNWTGYAVHQLCFHLLHKCIRTWHYMMQIRCLKFKIFAQPMAFVICRIPLMLIIHENRSVRSPGNKSQQYSTWTPKPRNLKGACSVASSFFCSATFSLCTCQRRLSRRKFEMCLLTMPSKRFLSHTERERKVYKERRRRSYSLYSSLEEKK